MFRYTYIVSHAAYCTAARLHMSYVRKRLCIPTTDQSSNYRRTVAIYRTSSHTVLCNCCHTVPETRSSITGLEVGGHDPLTLHFQITQGNENKYPAVVYNVHEI
jgi:hypothetical protein